MRMKSAKRLVLLSIGIIFAILSFQNCAPASFSSATDQSSLIDLTIYVCQGVVPAYANLCAGDDTSLLANANRLVVDACTAGVKCEYTCALNYRNVGGFCQLIPTSYACQGPVPKDANLCSGDDAGLTADANRVVVNACTPSVKCEYTCATNYQNVGGACQLIPATYACQGPVPSNANLCSGDDTNLTANANRLVVDACSAGVKCEYTCATDYQNVGGFCQLIPTSYACQNAVPSDANLCPGDDADLTANANRVVVNACTAAKCEYTCATNYYNASGVCTACTGTPILTQHPDCPAGQTGLITQTRTRLTTTCPASGQYVFTYSDWTTVSNTCAMPSPIVTAIATGYLHTCAIVDGGVQCWGYNLYGQLGDGSTTNRQTPVKVIGLSSGVTAISAGFFSTCAIVSGAAKCWGYNLDGELGDGTTTNKLTPTQVTGLNANVTAISVSRYLGSTCAIVNGAAQCWGTNEFGALGSGPPINPFYVTVPTPVTGFNSGVSEISTGLYYNTCAIVNGAAQCWGWNDYGQVGDGTFGIYAQKNVPAAVLLTPNTGVQSITAGYQHTCAIVNGAASCWGYNLYGPLGDNTTTDKPTPTPVTGLNTGVTAISAGHQYTCAIVSGAAKCWGLNSLGNLGDGTTTNRSGPTQVSDLNSGVQAISAGFNHTCAIVNNAAKCWGSSYMGILLGNGTTVDSSVPVDVGPWQ